MSFEITPIAGTAKELNVDLSKPSQHEREEFVIEEVKKAIDHVVTALGGYLSVSCNGNINPISGESGDLVNIYITSLPAPPVAATPEPVETQEGVSAPEESKPEDPTSETVLPPVTEASTFPSESIELPTAEEQENIVASEEARQEQETAPVEQPQELTQPPVIESASSPTVPSAAPSQPVENLPVVSEQPES